MDIAEKTSILIVDDLPDKLLVVVSVLESLGQNLVTARSGREALRCVLERDFAVILLDVNMPDIDGFETAELIRQRKRSAQTPIIFITSFNDDYHALRGYSLGAVDYILAPVSAEILRTKVGVFVELYQKTELIRRQAEERVALAREQAARALAEESSRRSAFLAQASESLVSSLDHETTVRNLVRLMVPFLGDLGCIALLDESGRCSQAELAWADAGGDARNLSLHGIDELPSALAESVQRAVETTKADMVAELPDPGAGLWRWQSDSAQAERPGFALASCISVPLVARGRTLGALAVAMGPSGRQHAAGDVALAKDLASRAASAIDNARLYRDIQEADVRKNEFLAMLAHELRNPLAPIRTAVHLLRMTGSSTPEARWAQDLIDRQLQQMVRLIDDLLDVSRITRGKIALVMEPADVALVVRHAVESSRPLVESQRHELTVALPDEPLWIECDVTRLAQVFSNLLNNAAKYTREAGRIWLTVVREGDEAVVRVRDSGMGIPAAMLAKVFDLFIQVDHSLDRSQGGLGIGLTLVRRLVEMQRGTVHAASDGPNLGSEFVVRLPVLAEPAFKPLPVAPTEPAPDQAAPLRVLVVDDNTDGANSLAMVLRMSGHDVRVAHDGLKALEQAFDFRPRVVLLDIGLPEIDGYEVARRMRREPGLGKLLLVAITGYGREEDRLLTKQAGFDLHLVKPVDAAQLPEIFARLIPNE